MSEAIRSYMDGRIASFKSDDALCEIASGSQDESVRALQKALWFQYSDVEDHKFVGPKQEWDYFNRLLLLLSSDAEAEWCATGGRWNTYKTLSALGLAGFGVVALRAGLGKVFVLYWILSGLVGLVLHWVSDWNDRRAWAPLVPIFPFPSVKSILCLRRQVVNFAKKPYPKTMSGRAKIRRYLDRLRWIVFTFFLVLLAPLALLILALPIRQTELRLRLPSDCV